jgi:hypothetical protein
MDFYGHRLEATVQDDKEPHMHRISFYGVIARSELCYAAQMGIHWQAGSICMRCQCRRHLFDLTRLLTQTCCNMDLSWVVSDLAYSSRRHRPLTASSSLVVWGRKGVPGYHVSILALQHVDSTHHEY